MSSDELLDLALLSASARKWRRRLLKDGGDNKALQSFVYYQGLTDLAIDKCEAEIRDHAKRRDERSKLALCNDQTNTEAVNQPLSAASGNAEQRAEDGERQVPAHTSNTPTEEENYEVETPPKMTNAQKNAAMKKESNKK